jgi:ribosomal protein L11 methylase PrmA
MIRYDSEYTFTFHSPGLEPWVLGLLRQFKPKSVLDVGCGPGFWGFILKGYLGVPRVVGVDIDPVKVELAKMFNVYDELYVSDIPYTVKFIYDLGRS